MNAVIPRLVRVQDRLTLGRDDAAVWRVNPRTRFLETRAGLSWTGVREYRTPTGLLRVLRRPEQVNSEGHKRTLRKLGAPAGHPASGVDITPANAAELLVGYTGEIITVEELDGYPRPVSDVTVFKPEAIVRMVDEATWRDYCELVPECSRLRHNGEPPQTGTSLGYNALWYGPHIEAEIVSERDDGELVGEWQGPHGPERYDIEHVVDPDCEIVQRLVRNTGFDASMLGGNHFAVCLPPLGGRGAEQSELLRVVDSLDLPIEADRARRFGRVTLQVPVMPAPVRDEKWTVGASRDLTVVPGDWDGDAAAASVFVWAGFDADSPDPAKARQAFLIYDADAPDVRKGYKLPIARYRDGRLEVVKGGLDAAASYLPQTDAPQDVLDRARGVLDHYYEKFRKQQGGTQDAAPPEKIIMNKLKIQIGLGRDAAKSLTSLGLKVPEALALTLDEMDATKIQMKLEELQGIVGDLMAMVGESASEMDGMKAKMADMMTVEEAQAKVDEVQAKLAEAQAMLAESKAAAEKATADAAKAQATADKLEGELAPLQAEQFARLCDEAIAAGFDAEAVKACADAAALRRLVVSEKVGPHYAEMRDAKDGAKEYIIDDESVQHAFAGAWAGVPKKAPPAAAATQDAKTAPAAPSRTFDSIPLITTQRDAKQTPDPKTTPAPVNTEAELQSGMGCL